MGLSDNQRQPVGVKTTMSLRADPDEGPPSGPQVYGFRGFAITPSGSPLATSTATTATIFWPCLVDNNRPPVDFFPIHGFDCGLTFFSIAHRYKGKATWAAGFPVSHHGDFVNGTVSGELVAKRIFGGRIREVSNVNPHAWLQANKPFSATDWESDKVAPQSRGKFDDASITVFGIVANTSLSTN